MARCEVCGNDYEASFEVVRHKETHTFDCFECAIHALAPACGHCGCRVIGHGTERGGRVFCCSHCARVGTDTESYGPAPAQGEAEGEGDQGEDEADTESTAEEERDEVELEEPSEERLDEIAQETRSIRQRAEDEMTGPEQSLEDDEDEEGDDEDDEDEEQ